MTEAWSNFSYILIGVIGVTWLPAGFAGAGVVYAITVRKYPHNFLKNGTSNEVMFILLTLCGWYSYGMSVLALYLNREHRGAGILWPGKAARQEAERRKARSSETRRREQNAA
ncbi:MAG: hypothetical protein HYS26_02290 [Candidatus Kaiserbacteria bacterium]|nr:MAG: hypothetical protein HYS26_02290 [Candidatus Kaiserbacteria bacterium]